MKTNSFKLKCFFNFHTWEWFYTHDGASDEIVPYFIGRSCSICGKSQRDMLSVGSKTAAESAIRDKWLQSLFPKKSE